NIHERDPETQAVFEKDKFYYIGDKIIPNNYGKDKKVKIAVSISMHLMIFDKISASNKCPLKVALIGIPQEMLQEVKNSENAIIQTFITDYIFGEECNFIVKTTFLYLNPCFAYLKNTVCPHESLIFVAEQMEIFNNEFYVYATDINFVDTCFESKKRYFDNTTTQITSTPKNSIHSKLFVTHQNVLKNTNEKFENKGLPLVNSDNFHDSSRSTSSTNSQLLKHVRVENISIEQTNQEFNEKNDLADYDQEKYKEITNEKCQKNTSNDYEKGKE
ncbi:1587_t:CDS:2, partial [Scutellospora calospora]